MEHYILVLTLYIFFKWHRVAFTVCMLQGVCFNISALKQLCRMQTQEEVCNDPSCVRLSHIGEM